MADFSATEAVKRARRLYRSPGFRGAYVKGARAAAVGLSTDACPYKRERGNSWRSVYRAAWLSGYLSVAADRPE